MGFGMNRFANYLVELHLYNTIIYQAMQEGKNTTFVDSLYSYTKENGHVNL